MLGCRHWSRERRGWEAGGEVAGQPGVKSRESGGTGYSLGEPRWSLVTSREAAPNIWKGTASPPGTPILSFFSQLWLLPSGKNRCLLCFEPNPDIL